MLERPLTLPSIPCPKGSHCAEKPKAAGPVQTRVGALQQLPLRASG